MVREVVIASGAAYMKRAAGCAWAWLLTQISRGGLRLGCVARKPIAADPDA
jgi:hypothetical protein